MKRILIDVKSDPVVITGASPLPPQRPWGPNRLCGDTEQPPGGVLKKIMGKHYMEDVDVLILNGRILTLDENNRIIADGYIAIKDGQILALGETEALNSRYRGEKVLNAKGGMVMPGLINAHTHAAMTCFRGIADDMALLDWLNNYIFPAEAKNVDPELAYGGSLLACAEMIKSGTTTFCDMYIFEDETAQAAKEAGMRCLVGEVLFDFPSPNAKSPSEALAYTRRLIEKWAGDPLINIVVEPHSLYTCQRSLLLEAKALANEYKLPFATHLLESKGEIQLLNDKLGMKATHYLRELKVLDPSFIAFHGVYLDDEDMAIFADHGCKVVHNPKSNMKLASGVAPVTEMIRKGIPVGLGTDGCASNNTLDMFQEMDTAAKLGKLALLDPTVMSARTVLRMATCQGADVLGMGGRIGSLQVGMQADLIVIDTNKPHLTPMYHEYSHLVYAANGSDVNTVLINGRVVMESRKLLTIDEGKVMTEVRRIAERIKSSMDINQP
jgi:5-methylthioadenosine/S-adenosylhomocysteine deaminase